ncbi:MAG: radical SAM domain-containing protein, partial [Pseudomonadota bacterium]
KTARDLIAVGVSDYQISLDGIPEIHDLTRKKFNGDGTFEEIWKNLRKMKQLEENFNVLLRVHYTPQTFRSLPTLINLLNENFSSDSRYSVIFKSIGQYGGKNDGSITPVSRQEEIAAERALNSNLLSTDLINDHNKNEDFKLCYAAKPNAYAIRADGSLNKCTVALADDKNKVGHLKPDGTFELNHEKHKKWIKGIFTKQANTLECPYSEIKNAVDQETIDVKVVQ